MKKVVYSLLVALLLIGLVETTAMASYGIEPKIIAGQNEWVGGVHTTGNWDGSITLNFKMKDGHCITDAAVHTGLSLSDFPQNRGGAIPGQFDYKYDFHGCVTSVSRTIADPAGKWGDPVYIAVHVNVIHPDGREDTGWTVYCGQLSTQQFAGKNWSGWYLLPADAWFSSY